MPRSGYFELDLPRRAKHEIVYSDPAELSAPPWTTVQGATPYKLCHSLVGYIHPDLRHIRSVLTVSDLLHLHHPELFSAAELERRAALYEPSIREAGHIICISEFTRRDVIARMNVSADKVSVVGLVPDGSGRRRLPAETHNRLLKGLNITSPFVLYPAQPWPHKNHERLLLAWREARARLPSGWRLILTGQPFPYGHPANPLIGETGALHLGYRSPLEMQALFQGCSMLVFPSLFEGFGLPVAEAMMAGKPVACSNLAVLREIAGDSAHYFNPENIGHIANAIEAVATSAEHKERALRSGAALARLAPEKIALETLRVYLRCLGRSDSTVSSIMTQRDWTPTPFSRHLPHARHHARRAEEAGKTGHWALAVSGLLATAIYSPSMAYRRLIVGWWKRLRHAYRSRNAASTRPTATP